MMADKKEQKIALIVGAGDHLGSAIAKRFAQEGFAIVATRRRGDLTRLISDLETSGTSAHGFHSDARSEEQVRELYEKVESDIGAIDVVVFNVGGNVRSGITETTSAVYRKSWEMCAFAGFLVGREAALRMLPRGAGTILFTGASASLRGAKGFAAFSGGKQALRALAQSMAKELGPQGIHVGHVVVDGLIENRSTEQLFPDLVAARPQDGIIQPEHLADIYWQLHKQHRTAWTFELDVRPYSEPW